MEKRKITVLGSGINGLCCAWVLSDIFDVEVVSDRPVEETGSWHESILYEPQGHLSEDDPFEVIEWAGISWNKWKSLAKEIPECVQIRPTIYLSKKPFTLQSYYVPENFFLPHYIVRNNPLLSYYPHGYGHLGATVNPTKFLPILMEKLHSRGVKFTKRKIRKIPDDGKIYVNCTGYGSKKLFKDDLMYVTEGKTVLVYAPWIQEAINDDDQLAYIIPTGDGHVVCGGTHGRETFQTSDEDILAKCANMVPSIIQGKKIRSKICSRPCRKGGIRCEKEVIGGTTFIHNYGHAGSGWIYCWGCAESVKKLILKQINNKL